METKEAFVRCVCMYTKLHTDWFYTASLQHLHAWPVDCSSFCLAKCMSQEHPFSRTWHPWIAFWNFDTCTFTRYTGDRSVDTEWLIIQWSRSIEPFWSSDLSLTPSFLSHIRPSVLFVSFSPSHLFGTGRQDLVRIVLGWSPEKPCRICNASMPCRIMDSWIHSELVKTTRRRTRGHKFGSRRSDW